MEPFANNPAANSWPGQPTPAGFSQTPPVWAAQPAPAGAANSWPGQPGTPQPTPAWVGQSSALPVGAIPTRLDRKPSWPALRLIARWLKIIAWIELVFSAITAIGIGIAISSVGSYMGGSAYAGSSTYAGSSASASSGSSGAGFFGLVLTIYLLVGAVLGFIMIYASAETILVFLAIEKNTQR